MKSLSCAALTCLVALAVTSADAVATDYHVTITAGAGIPMGDFAEADDIIRPTGLGTYEALGGGAEIGYGFNIELDFRVMPWLCLGGRFGYLRHDADADDIMEQGLTPSEVTAIEAIWTWTALGAFGRGTFLESSDLGLYGRVDMGASKMKNAFDVTFDVPGVGSSVSSADFDLGNQFYFGGAIGAEYWVSEAFAFVTEMRLTYYLSDGAEASASLGQYTLAGTQAYNSQVFDIMVGVRISLAGI
jgi:hypothetical protein